jgi:hypothetical protein
MSCLWAHSALLMRRGEPSRAAPQGVDQRVVRQDAVEEQVTLLRQDRLSNSLNRPLEILRACYDTQVV